MKKTNEINELFGISESFMLPERLMTLLTSDEISSIFEKYVDMQGDLSCDGFTDYFQEEHSNRKAMMQDFTPRELSELVSRIAVARGEVHTCLDVCSGTGGLTIALHNIKPKCVFWCEELSKRAVPLLLFNLAVRNISAYVTNKDVLSGEINEAWQIVPGERFGTVISVEQTPEILVDVCITNPPYSLKHEFDEKKLDRRFDGFGYPPKQFADYAFVLHGMSRLKDGGRLVAILPHGVLFRGSREEIIRHKMVENGMIHAVIGLPDNLFINTGIPVAILVFEKKRAEQVMFIDGAKGFMKTGKINQLRSQDLEKIISALVSGRDIPKYSHTASKAEIAENGYNLNISRYVDTYEPSPPIDIVEVTKELLEIREKRADLEEEIYGMISELISSDEKTAAELERVRKSFARVAGAAKACCREQLSLEDLL